MEKKICNSIGSTHLCNGCGASVPHTGCEPCPLNKEAKCVAVKLNEESNKVDISVLTCKEGTFIKIIDLVAYLHTCKHTNSENTINRNFILNDIIKRLETLK